MNNLVEQSASNRFTPESIAALRLSDIGRMSAADMIEIVQAADIQPRLSQQMENLDSDALVRLVYCALRRCQSRSR